MDPEDISKVQEIISKAEFELKSIEVKKLIPLELDLGNLLVTDKNELDKTKFRGEEEADYLKDLARDGAQFLINKIWDLPSDTIDNGIYAILPETVYLLPREKRVPIPKPPTRWEEFAKEKGIQKKKKGNLLWDEVLRDWIPRHGFRKAQAVREKNWVMEVPDNADPYEDQFQKAAESKKERVAKNEYLRLRNIAKAKNIRVPNVGVTSFTMKSTGEMGTALKQTRLSTASLGKFQKALPQEKPLPEAKRGSKRKRVPNDSSTKGMLQDKKRALEVLSKMKKKELNFEAAVNQQVKMDNIQESHKGRKVITSGRRSKHGGKQRSKSDRRALAKGLIPEAGMGSKGGSGKKGGTGKKGGAGKAGGADKMGRSKKKGSFSESAMGKRGGGGGGGGGGGSKGKKGQRRGGKAPARGKSKMGKKRK